MLLIPLYLSANHLEWLIWGLDHVVGHSDVSLDLGEIDDMGRITKLLTGRTLARKR